ncbi:MAG TPA: hypothetical protein VKH19_14345 [Gemmatimonadaceae bacterium]|nr:hypothetical protein [Gemmatimonadaceae bacterium]
MAKKGWLDTAALAAELGLDAAQQRQLEQRVSAWDEKLRPVIDGIRSCEIVTKSDLSVRINVRDSR